MDIDVLKVAWWLLEGARVRWTRDLVCVPRRTPRQISGWAMFFCFRQVAAKGGDMMPFLACRSRQLRFGAVVALSSVSPGLQSGLLGLPCE